MPPRSSEKIKPATPPAGKAAHETRPFAHSEIRTIVIGIMLAMFLAALDQTIVATALPTIGRAFNDVANLPWIVTAYLLVSTAVTPIYGKMSDIHGRRVVMLSGIVLFIAGSVMCALAHNMLTLVLGRAVQGLGGGGLMALAQTILADVVSPRERGRYQGYIGAVFASSSVGGPVLGGVLAEHLHWSLIFWINLPLGLAALMMTSSALKMLPRPSRKRKLDLPGAALMTSAAVLLLLALTWGGTAYPWLSAQIGGLLLCSALLWGLFAWRIAVAEDPFLPLAILSNAIVRCASLSGACAMGVLVGLTIYAPLYFEVVRHLTASEAGVALIPMLGAVVTAATISGRAMVHVDHYKRMPLAGLVVGILALLALAIWTPQLSVFGVIALLTCAGFSVGCVFPISTVAMQNAVPAAQVGTATGAANFFRSLVSALVVAIFGAIILGATSGGTGISVDTLSRSATGGELTLVFRFVFLAAALVLAFSLSFMISMEEKPLRGPVAKEAATSVGSAQPIAATPPEKLSPEKEKKRRG